MGQTANSAGSSRLSLQPGTVVVFEGLDKAGKSTQLDLLQEVIEPGSAFFAHMPSGSSPFTHRMYRTLESPEERPTSGLAQQLAHLACHAESMPGLVQALTDCALILDRWWWSTLAYGWYGGPVATSGLSRRSFEELINTIWAPIEASVVFVFLEPHQRDDNNTAGVDAGYRELTSAHRELAVEVADGAPQTSIHLFSAYSPNEA